MQKGWGSVGGCGLRLFPDTDGDANGTGMGPGMVWAMG